MKPRFLVDIKNLSKRYNKIEPGGRINLGYQKIIYIPLGLLLKIFVISLVVFYFIFGSVTAPTFPGIAAAQNNNEERKVLEAQLAELENQISEYEKTIEAYRQKGKSLENEIKTLEAKIAKLNLQIKAINLSLAKLDQEIVITQTQINQTESNILLNKKNLAQVLQIVYENDNRGLIEIILEHPKFSDFFNDLNNLLMVQDNLRIVIAEIVEARQKLIDQKEVLALQRSDAAALKAYQDAQKASIAMSQSEKNNLLKVTKGRESEYNKLLTETKKTAAEVRKQIFKLLGGGELAFEEAYQLAKMAEKATGVRAAFILAVLDRESALGQNVGQCVYDKNPYYPSRASNPTTMHPTRDIPIFLQITKELGLDPKNMFVSCPIPSDGAYGGAMGPAQFLPSTWKIYKNRIAEITGNNPPSPWRNADAFVATALYLKDAGAGAGASLTKEREAAARYYAGSRWSSYLWTYGARVISLAQKFEEDIAILSS